MKRSAESHDTRKPDLVSQEKLTAAALIGSSVGLYVAATRRGIRERLRGWGQRKVGSFNRVSALGPRHLNSCPGRRERALPSGGGQTACLWAYLCFQEEKGRAEHFSCICSLSAFSSKYIYVKEAYFGGDLV